MIFIYSFRFKKFHLLVALTTAVVILNNDKLKQKRDQPIFLTTCIRMSIEDSREVFQVNSSNCMSTSYHVPLISAF